MYELSASSTLAAIAGSAAASRIEPTPASARWRGAPSGSVVVGVSGAAQNAAAAICVNGRLQAFCEQERVSRIRRAGVDPGKLPDEGIDSGAAAERLSPYFRYADGSLRVGAGWQEFVRDWLAEGRSDALASRAHVASSVQAKLGEILCLLLAEVKRASDAVNICLAGGL